MPDRSRIEWWILSRGPSANLRLTMALLNDLGKRQKSAGYRLSMGGKIGVRIIRNLKPTGTVRLGDVHG